MWQAKAASQGKAATTATEPAVPATLAATSNPALQTETSQAAGKRTADAAVQLQPHKAKKQKTGDGQAADVNAAPGTDANGEVQGSLKQVKWKKLAAQVLEASSGTVKLSKLQKRLRTMAQVDKSLSAEADAAILARLKGSSQFVISGKSVGLAEQQSV